MTGICAGCVAIARPYALGIPGRARHDARVSGTADLPFRTIAVIPGRSRHERKSTANAVGCNHPPGFKSPILRSLSSSYVRALQLRRAAAFRFPGPLRGHRRNLAAHLPHPLPAPPRGPQPCPETGAARPHNQSAGRDVCRWFASRARRSVRSAKSERQGRRDKGLAPAADPGVRVCWQLPDVLAEHRAWAEPFATGAVRNAANWCFRALSTSKLPGSKPGSWALSWCTCPYRRSVVPILIRPSLAA